MDWDPSKRTHVSVPNSARSRGGSCLPTPTLRNAPSIVRSATSESTRSCSSNRWENQLILRLWVNLVFQQSQFPITLPSRFVLQHISSRRHRDGVAGKPNPLLSRHKKRTDFMVETLPFFYNPQYSTLFQLYAKTCRHKNRVFPQAVSLMNN